MAGGRIVDEHDAAAVSDDQLLQGAFQTTEPPA
jgi:hypothetical protein